jgi:integrase
VVRGARSQTLPPLEAVLREHRQRALAAGRASGEAFVFSTRNGTAIAQPNATRTIARAATTAGLEGVGFHTLRHSFASILIIDLGLDSVRVQRQLGHARPSITLDVYAHLFDHARHADDLRERIGSSALASAVTRS